MKYIGSYYTIIKGVAHFMEDLTLDVLKAYNYWYPPARIPLQRYGTLPCGHRGVIGAPMCRTCADALITQSHTDTKLFTKFLNELVTSYVEANQRGPELVDFNEFPGTPPLPSFAEEFLTYLNYTNHAEGTVTVYAGVLGLFFAYLSNDPANYTLEELSKIDLNKIETFLTHCKDRRKNKPASLAHKRAAIKSLFRYLIHKEKLTLDPTEKLDAIFVQEKLPQALEPDDVSKLADELKSGKRYKWTKERDRAIVFTVLGTGLKVSELCNLNLIDVDFQHGLLKIGSKNGLETNVPFGEDVEKALQSYIKVERPKYEAKLQSPALFLSIRGTRISVDAVQVLVVNSLKSIGVQGFNTHKLRTTAAALLLRETGDLDLVQDFLRHKDPNRAMRYSAILQDGLRTAAKQIKIVND